MENVNMIQPLNKNEMQDLNGGGFVTGFVGLVLFGMACYVGYRSGK